MSERSESLRSESGYSSDQARSTLSSMSAPAALADRLPADSGRPQASNAPPPPLPCTLQPRIGGTRHTGRGRTWRQPRGHDRVAGGRPDESRAAPVGRSPTPIPRSSLLNYRSPLNPRSSAGRSNIITRRPTAAAGFSSPPAVSASPGPSAASLNTRLTPVSEWPLQNGTDGSRERTIIGTSSSSSSSSSFFCENVSSIDSDGEDQRPSDL